MWEGGSSGKQWEGGSRGSFRKCWLLLVSPFCWLTLKYPVAWYMSQKTTFHIQMVNAIDKLHITFFVSWTVFVTCVFYIQYTYFCKSNYLNLFSTSKMNSKTELTAAATTATIQNWFYSAWEDFSRDNKEGKKAQALQIIYCWVKWTQTRIWSGRVL